ncbi:MAG: hypothetical protein ACRDWH_03730, partial [Acidimicrobiia bacterium]
RAFLTLFLVVVALPASAQEVHICWADTLIAFGKPVAVTRCRVAGEIVDYATEYEVPLVLYPSVGTASNGTCWYWRTAWTGWVMITRYSDGTADFGFDSDGVPGGPLNLDVNYPICLSEPTEVNPADLLA